MSGLLSNASRALLRPANPRDYTHTASRIICATLPVTIASTLARPAHGAFMGFTTCRMVSIPPPLNGAAWRVRPSGPDRGLIRSCGVVGAPRSCTGGRILLRAYSRMRPLPVSGRLHMPPARSGCPKPGKGRKEVMPDTHAASGLGDA